MVAQFSPEENDVLAMLKGAERTIEKYNVSASELDAWSIRSHQLAKIALEHNYLENCVLPMEGKRDESLRPRMSQRLLDRMPPVLGEDTKTHAGNACLTHDGAAFLLLSNAESEFRIVHSTSWAGEPLYSPERALEASKKVLAETHLTMEDMSAIEWNEAFAVIDVLFERNFKSQIAVYNRFGGALAYGHPFGCSGAIILLHLMESLRYSRGRYGLCAIAGAGGTGTTTIIERCVK